MDDNDIKKLYDELAEKEQALILAAQFGKTLIDEKEDLEKQIEIIKREHQSQLEYYEQESFEMRRLIEQIRNEYESKISELNEDINLLNKEIKQYKNLNIDILNSKNNNENLELIQELTEKNQNLLNQLKMMECQLSFSNEKCEQLESSFNELNQQFIENSNLISNYQKEKTKWSNKQKELEFVLMQSCTERDKQGQILEELGKKFLIIENEKNELENLVYRHENENYNLRRINKFLSLKLKNLSKINMSETRNNDSFLVNRTSFNYATKTTLKFAEEDSALDSMSNLDNTSEYDDDFDIDSTYLDMFKGQEIDEDIENNSVDIVDNMHYFNCGTLVVNGVSWKQESSENEVKSEIKKSKTDESI